MFLFVLLTALVMPFGLHLALPSVEYLQRMVTVVNLPAVIESGNAVESFTVPENIPRPFALGPDGSTYAVYNSYDLLKIAPDGSTSYIVINFPVPNRATEYGAIVYADGYLWFQSFEGYIHMKPDGTNVTYHQQRFGYPVVAAPNGVYVTLSNGVEFIDGATYKRTLYPIIYKNVAEYNSVGAMTIGADGHLYFDFRPNTSFLDMLVRLESNGTYTFFGKNNTACGTPAAYGGAKFVSTKLGIYFIGTPNGNSYDLCHVSYTGFFTRLTTPLTPSSSHATPAVHYSPPTAIDADDTGNIWTANTIGAGLYSYDTATKQIAGPYEPALLQNLAGYLVIGPDQNVWLYGQFADYRSFYGAYVRHLETFAPTSVNLSFLGQTIDFYVSEPLKSAPWTAYSLDPTIATVGPGSYRLGKFKVTAVSRGATSIVVTDAYGNVRREPVTVTASTIPR